jgi:DNA-binding MarR family transcriptional regulator
MPSRPAWSYMYYTCMTSSADTLLPRLDAALLSLRRLTNAPAARPRLTQGTQQIEFSTMLVVDAIARLGDSATRHEVSVVDVANVLQVAPSTASRLVERAVKAGMTTRGPSGVDPRRAALALTRAGRALHADAIAFRTGRLRVLVRDWSEAELTVFTELFERFAERVRSDTDPSHAQGDST